MNRKGFTLVELIVVITILAVLGTISFVSLQGYASEGRDSKRISDVNSIRKVLEYDVLKKGYYILPENGVNVTYNTGGQSKAVWQQGIFGESNRVELGAGNSLSKVPRDPLTNTYYTYSVLNTKKEIQIGAVLEGGVSYGPNLITDTYARGNEIGWSYIVGNYNGKVAKVTMGGNMYIFAVPSIISTDLNSRDILTVLSNNKLALNGTTKLPGSYDRTNYNLDGENQLIVNNVSQPVLSTSTSSDIDPLELITNLQGAYTGLTLSNNYNLTDLLTVDTSDSGSVESYYIEIADDNINIPDTTLPYSGGNGSGNPELEELIAGGVDNGITVTCLERTPGDTFVEDGVTYLVVSTRQDIIDNMASINSTYNLCTSHVTDMSFLFFDNSAGSEYIYASTFNEDISSWDTSNVESFIGTFNRASSFNQNIGPWDVSSATTMDNMFYSASTFNQDLITWDVSNVIDMSGLFNRASSFNGDISTWDVSSVQDLSFTFSNASSFNGDISAWDVSSVENMFGLFSSATSFNGDIGNWDVSSVKNMTSTFRGANSFNRNLNNWDVGEVTTMNSMFNSNSSYNNDGVPLTFMNITKVSSMYGMFSGASSFNVDLSGLDVSGVNNMGTMFSSANSFNQDLSSWDMSSVSNVSWMFSNTINFNNGGNPLSWDLSGVRSNNGMQRMLYGTRLFNQDLTNWCVPNIPSTPTNFADNSALDPSNYPVWGTCPSNI